MKEDEMKTIRELTIIVHLTSIQTLELYCESQRQELMDSLGKILLTLGASPEQFTKIRSFWEEYGTEEMIVQLQEDDVPFLR